MDILKQSTIDQLIEYLLTNMNGGRLIPSGKEFSCRCPFCGDSVSDQFATSFYINIDPTSSNFLNYHCFRANCGTNGIINEEFLDNIGFNNRECVKNLNEYFRNRGQYVNNTFKAKGSKSLVNVINAQSKVSDKKLEYINTRLGLSLDYKDLYDLKINLSLMELLQINNIKITSDKIAYYSNLSDYGISFISAYNDYVIVRDISKSKKLRKRYSNINIFDNYDNVTKAYCIPTEIDLVDPSPCIINIAEGAFDILSVYYNLKINRKYRNQIFLAASGAGITNVILSYIRQYGLINCKINIFSDSDVPIERYKKLNLLRPYLKNFDIEIYYNDMPGEKDFGVSKDKIKIIKSKL